MYGPAPIRPKKTDICRTRTGCLTCRRRHRKCDEGKPSCLLCSRAGLPCEGYSRPLIWVSSPADGKASTKASNPTSPGALHLTELSTSSSLAEVPALGSRFLDERCSRPGSDSRKRGKCDLHVRPPPSARPRPVSQHYHSQSRPPTLVRQPETRESFMLHHFYTAVIESLPHTCRNLVLETRDNRQCRMAILAISASSLFHSYLFQRDTRTNLKCIRRPDNNYAREYYRYAITVYQEALQLSKNRLETGSTTSPYYDLAATLLMSLFEWVSGSPFAYLAHLSGADDMVLSCHAYLSQTTAGTRLLEVWARMRLQKNRKRLSFRPFDVEVDDASRRRAADLCHYYLSPNDAIESLLTDAYNLRTRIVLLTFMNYNASDSASVIRLSREWYSTSLGYNFDDDLPSGECCFLSRVETLERLGATSRSLHLWHATLSALEKPTNLASTLPETSTLPKDTDAQIKPLKFHNSRAAIAYLHYGIGRVLSSRRVFEHCLARKPMAASLNSMPEEVVLVLSILIGLDSSTIVSTDTFDHGPLWVIGVLALCIPDDRITRYLLGNVLPRLEASISHGSLLRLLAKVKRDITFVHEQILAGFLPMLCDANELMTADYHSSGDERIGDKAICVGRGVDGKPSRRILDLPLRAFYISNSS